MLRTSPVMGKQIVFVNTKQFLGGTSNFKYWKVAVIYVRHGQSLSLIEENKFHILKHFLDA